MEDGDGAIDIVKDANEGDDEVAKADEQPDATITDVIKSSILG